MKRVKPYRIQIVGGFGKDRLGIKRDFREWITGNGSILEYEGKDANDFTVWKIYDENGKLIRVKDWIISTSLSKLFTMEKEVKS